MCKEAAHGYGSRYGVVDCQTGTGGRSFGRGEVSRGEVSPGKSAATVHRDVLMQIGSHRTD